MIYNYTLWAYSSYAIEERNASTFLEYGRDWSAVLYISAATLVSAFFLFRFGCINNSTVGRRPNPALTAILSSYQGNDKPMTYLLLYWQLAEWILTNAGLQFFLASELHQTSWQLDIKDNVNYQDKLVMYEHII